MLRMKINRKGTSLITYNETTESTLFEDEVPNYPLEFSKNRLFVTGFPS